MKKHVLGLIALLAACPATSSAADPVADFYRGKQMQFIIRTPPGGDYDSYSRLLARHMGGRVPLTSTHTRGGG